MEVLWGGVRPPTRVLFLKLVIRNPTRLSPTQPWGKTSRSLCGAAPLQLQPASFITGSICFCSNEYMAGDSCWNKHLNGHTVCVKLILLFTSAFQNHAN